MDVYRYLHMPRHDVFAANTHRLYGFLYYQIILLDSILVSGIQHNDLIYVFIMK